ncbi:MAG: hypothetical protein ACYC5Y_09830 [Symbiobacteriia bacterium]
MLEMQYIVGLVMALVQVLKLWVRPEYLPLLAVALGGVLNTVNAVLFGGNVLEAVKDGIVAAGLAIGIFSGVKNTFQTRTANGGSKR